MKEHVTKFNSKLLLTPALLAASVVAVMIFAEEETPAVKTETLLHTNAAWDGVPYAAYPVGEPEMTVLKITIPAHGELPWHSHPMPTAAYVVSGEITVMEPGGASRHFSAGEVIPETVNLVHRGVVGNTPAVFLVFYPGVKGLPLSTRK